MKPAGARLWGPYEFDISAMVKVGRNEIRIRIARDACLGTPDILPSVLGLMGLPIPDRVEGMDLSRLALGKGGPEPGEAFLRGARV